MKIRISKAACFWTVFTLLVIGCTLTFHSPAHDTDEFSGGERPYDLSPQELSMLRIESEKGSCDAAYRVAQYHLYASSDIGQAEKYYRLAAKCPNPDALTGLIVVLRKPENDPELDQIIVSLRKLDPKMGESASIEVAERRAARTSR